VPDEPKTTLECSQGEPTRIKMAVATFSQGQGEVVAEQWAGWAGRGERMRLEVEVLPGGGFVVRVRGVDDVQVRETVYLSE
jgi:hypothetical protein